MFNFIVSIFINYLIYNNEYSNLYNCSFITFASILKLLFFNNNIINKLLEFTLINSLLFYIIDTYLLINKINKIDEKNNKNNIIFISHHICACEIIFSRLLFGYNFYSFCLLIFSIELSGVFYNLYKNKFIKIKTYVLSYVPLRILSNFIFIYYILYDNIYVNNIQFIFDSIAYIFLFLFNIAGVVYSLKKIN
jgi:hypothetical protein